MDKQQGYTGALEGARQQIEFIQDNIDAFLDAMREVGEMMAAWSEEEEEAARRRDIFIARKRKKQRRAKLGY